MTVETTIQRMFDNYPDLFATRRDCYNHLFCVIGNGYEWKRGQIVEYGEDEELESFVEEAEQRDYAAQSAEFSKAKQTEENIKKKEDWRKLLVSNGVPESMTVDKWYPVCEFSLIKCIPADIKPDWKEAVEECKEMLRKDGIEV